MVLITVRVALHEVAEVGDDLAVAQVSDNVEETAMKAPADAPANFKEPDVDEIQVDGKSEEIVIKENNDSVDMKADASVDMCSPVAATGNTSTNCRII